MEIGLGLDLKGGMNVTLQISVADVLKSLSNNNPDPNFNAAIAAAQAAHGREQRLYCFVLQRIQKDRSGM